MMISGLYAGLCGVLLLLLSFQVVGLRRKFQVGIGSGGKEELTRAIRVQANFVEYTPITLILLILAELQGASILLLHAAGLLLVVGRALHAVGLRQSAGRTFGRFYGTLATWFALVVLIVTNLGAVVWAG
jgi:uncharacterized membrane protein YecN with MAPEG domain